jgi:uncharacterized protein Yka (UPF0111/DUF47 family)
MDILPVKLQTAKSVMSELLKGMYSNLNYYYDITANLHNSKNHTEQVRLVTNVTQNLHKLDVYIEEAVMELHELKSTNFEPTTKLLESYTPPTDREKEEMFDDHVQDLLRDLKLLNKKIGVVDTKCEELGDITDHFHDSTDKLEMIYVRDIAKKKQLY